VSRYISADGEKRVDLGPVPKGERKRLTQAARTGGEKKPDAEAAARKKLHALFREAGITSRADRIRFCAVVVGRTLGSSRDLSSLEVGLVLTALTSGILEDKSETPKHTDVTGLVPPVGSVGADGQPVARRGSD
jgi:hypothetical protein